jgi:hypothetical protein
MDTADGNVTTEELAEILTTPTVDVEYQVETGVNVR